MAETSETLRVLVIAEDAEAAKKFAAFAVSSNMTSPYENDVQCRASAAAQPPLLANRHFPFRVTFAAGHAVECVALDKRPRT